MSTAPYREQVTLLLRILPIIAREEAFALKGGTAINLFVRDLPRLSVDIDLTYLPLGDRIAALTGIREGLQRVETGIKRQLAGTRAISSTSKCSLKVRGSRMSSGLRSSCISQVTHDQSQSY